MLECGVFFGDLVRARIARWAGGRRSPTLFLVTSVSLVGKFNHFLLWLRGTDKVAVTILPLLAL